MLFKTSVFKKSNDITVKVIDFHFVAKNENEAQERSAIFLIDWTLKIKPDKKDCYTISKPEIVIKIS